MRTDGDTWDISTGVGATALFVAAARALEAAKSNPVAVDEFAEVFCRAAGNKWAALLDGNAPDHKLTGEFGEQFVDYQAARTRYFDDFFGGVARAGVRQIVLLAAGLDSRAYRLPWPDGTRVFELDQPRVLEFKRTTLDGRGVAPAAERIEVAVDLRDDWPAALHAAGFDDSAPSAWIVEGLLVYLPGLAQAQLFSGIDALSAPGSHIAVEDSSPLPSAEFDAARDQERSDGNDGTFFTLVYNEQHQPAAQWLGDHGWRAAATPLRALLAELGRHLPADDSPTGQMVQSITLVRGVMS